MNITITVNGKRIQAEVPAGQTLLQFLREQGYKSVKCGCETTNCGLCSVWMDEKTVLSCSVLADFMAKEGAEQCGFCSPGLIMQVLAMKKENRTWTDEEIKHWLAGNLCRCTGYMGQLRAIKAWLLKGGDAV